MKEVEVKDFGIINFGVNKGQKWNEQHRHYLEYLISDECMTSEANKEIARQVLKQKNLIKGQLEMELI